MDKKIKCIFLDLGGTFREVCENREYSLAARKLMAEICKTDMDPDAFYEYINKKYDVYREWALTYYCEAPEAVLWNRWLTPELDRKYVEEHAIELTYAFRRAKGERLVVDGGVETVRELVRRGYKVGVISDLVGTVEIDEWLERDGLKDLFCTVKQSSVTLLRKPHPAIYYQALDEAGVYAEESVFVGDNLVRDIGGAKATNFCGTVGIWYPSTKTPKPTNETNPDCFIHAFPELLNIFPGEGKYCPEAGDRSLRNE